MSPLIRSVIVRHTWVAWLIFGALVASVAACGVAAGVASFLWLTVLAVASGWTVAPWLLPLCVDALAAAGLLQWIVARSRYALGVAVGALAASVAGNVAAHVLPGTPLLQVGPWVAAVVAAVPPVSFGLVVHLVPLFLGSLAWLAETSTAPLTNSEPPSDGLVPPASPRESSPGSGSTSGASGSRTTRRRPTAVPAAGSTSTDALVQLLRGRPGLDAMSERALRSVVNGAGLSASTERIKAARAQALASPNGDRADVAGAG